MFLHDVSYSDLKAEIRRRDEAGGSKPERTVAGPGISVESCEPVYKGGDQVQHKSGGPVATLTPTPSPTAMTKWKIVWWDADEEMYQELAVELCEIKHAPKPETEPTGQDTRPTGEDAGPTIKVTRIPLSGLFAPGTVEEYIRNLQWSPDTSDEIKTYVAGNIRGFAAAARNQEITASTFPFPFACPCPKCVEKRKSENANAAGRIAPLRALVIARAIESITPEAASVPAFERAYDSVTAERPLLDWIISGQLLELIKAIVEVWKFSK